MLSEIIRKQVSSLRRLNLSRDNFSNRSTKMLLTTIAEGGVCSTLEDIDMWASANFDSEESYTKFA